ncbi:helix-turn-helix domain-containing protein [Richelia sinica]|uniref:helix-turn-helix domain-containing protein n=1 Tax=Richelia sinica TaxID=1357545 RepID=UPI001683199A|nr:helix-turn-helix transcriptional regulator [Richelia sinica]MBD2667311.1 helix-turn-helix transcriptional regulator [Richelia sinica FACHB-800]
MKKVMVCRLKNYMEEKQINIAQLAREVGITENAVRGYAKNTFNRIDCQVAIKLCDYFGVSIGEMFQIREVNNELV